VAFHGAPRFTGDLDILIHPTLEQVQRTLAALREFRFSGRTDRGSGCPRAHDPATGASARSDPRDDIHLRCELVMCRCSSSAAMLSSQTNGQRVERRTWPMWMPSARLATRPSDSSSAAVPQRCAEGIAIINRYPDPRRCLPPPERSANHHRFLQPDQPLRLVEHDQRQVTHCLPNRRIRRQKAPDTADLPAAELRAPQEPNLAPAPFRCRSEPVVAPRIGRAPPSTGNRRSRCP